MKTLAHVIGFCGVTAFAVPRIAAVDPEPVGAGASLYLFGLLLVIIGSAAFALSAKRRLIPYAPLVGLAVGVAYASFFYSSVAFAFPALSLVIVLVAGSVVSVLTSLGVPKLFRPLPNNSFKPRPLRGSA